MAGQSKSRMRSVTVRVSALVGTLIVILSCFMMPVSAGIFEGALENMDFKSGSCVLGSGSYTKRLDADPEDPAEDVSLYGYTEEDPFYCYYRIHVAPNYDGYTEESANLIFNMQYLYIPGVASHSVRWGGAGFGGSQIRHDIRYTDLKTNQTTNTWTRYSYAHSSVDEVFVQMWANPDTGNVEYKLYVWSYEDGLITRRETVDGSKGAFVQVRLAAQDCEYKVSYAFGDEAKMYFALANYEEATKNSYNAGYADGKNDWYQAGYDKGFETAESRGEAAAETARQEGYASGYQEGHTEGTAAGLQGFADYIKKQGVTFSDAVSYGTLYKAVRDKGWTECADQGTLTTKLIFTALEAPVNVILGAANFEVFGINFAAVTFAILAAVIVLFILRTVISVIL